MTRPRPNRLMRLLAGLLIMMAAGVLAIVVLKPGRESGTRIENLHIDSNAALKLNLIKQISKKNGITEWELEADTATLLKEKSRAVLTGVRVVFHTRDGEKVFLSSDQGFLDTQAHDADFVGHVTVRYQDYTLRTDKLHYQKKAHIIYSDLPVRIDGPDGDIQAEKMETRLNDKQIQFTGQVEGHFSEAYAVP